jgi:hypothetical protein
MKPSERKPEQTESELEDEDMLLQGMWAAGHCGLSLMARRLSA